MVRQLVGDLSVTVPAGKTVRVSFPLNDRSFASWDQSLGTDGAWRAIPGCYTLAAGSSSRDLSSTVTVARGSGCRGAQFSLPLSGNFALPLPPAAGARSIA